ncbi:hypothetical protein CIPAW_12G107800 [Carya illinoinensis]|uniref:No apical meristem-associated C-terminal domain-containing protein n=1 Tax=Carya illinoinensis TaxID=32201 RepID=A0A8T1NY89_CARIL|nr:hypothetical protein CIPAW_12G107800 [Carya illinoinensis]
MYFTNLLSEDPQLEPTYGGQCGISLLILDDSSPLPPNESIDVRKSMRGANFTPEEDKLLYFQQFKETTNEQTIKSLIHRWSVIQKATNKFCAKLAQVEGLNQSGMTEQDKFEKAKLMYQSLEKCPFQFEHCWHLLKDQPKWIWRATKEDPKWRKKMYPSPTPTRCSGAIVDSIFDLEADHVMENESRAQEKEFFRLKAEKMAYDKETEARKLRQEDERLRLEAEKVELAKKESDQRIMMMDVSVMPELQRQFFQQLQREVMARRSRSDDLD